MLTIHTTPHFIPEKEYVFHVLLREMLDINYQIEYDASAKNYRFALPNGAELTIEDHFFCHQLEQEYLQADQVPGSMERGKSPFSPDPFIVIFGNAHFNLKESSINCEADLIAGAFFMLTRWEELVLPFKDEHDRFPAEKSLAGKAGFLDRPVVNEWAALLFQMLAHLGWQQPMPKRQYSLNLSCDVDHPRLWWEKSDRIKTVGGAIFKRGSIGEAIHLLNNQVFNPKDPYDVFGDWFDIFEAKGQVVQFNFLGKRPPSSDCWYPLEHPSVIELLQKIAERGHKIGFHPSYESFGDQTLFEQELASLRAVSPVAINAGRQHYLRFSLPDTWRSWEKAGLETDSTLGYSEAEGFRCGICCEFPVFDVKSRKMLKLREKPLMAMDVTLALYRRYTPEQAADKLSKLRQSVEKHGGEFTLLWHNSSWETYFWRPWQRVLLDFIP